MIRILAFAARIVVLYLVFAASAQARTVAVTGSAGSGPNALRAAIASARAGNPIHSVASPASVIWTVNSVADTTDGVCDASNCTLREALAAAQFGDSIFFSSLFNSPQTIEVGSPLPHLAASVNIDGPGANLLTIRATASGFPILTIDGGVATIFFLTIADGSATDGGGIYVGPLGSLNLFDSVLSGNHASGNGGGIFNAGSVIVHRSTFVGNRAQSGGALYNASSTASAVSSSIESSTFSGNVAALRGNAIAAANLGGGASSAVLLLNCTIADHIGGAPEALAAIDAGGVAGFILKNDLFARNQGASVATIGAAAQIVSQGHNLASDTGGGFLAGPGDQVSTDPLLATVLGYYGGRMPTYLMALNSPAVNAGDATGAPTVDERNYPRGGAVDIGAVELQPVVVTLADDAGDGTCDSTCTLRDAITATNTNTSTMHDIFFGPLFDTPQTINLTAALPTIFYAMNLSGPGANQLTIRRDTGGDYHVFTVNTTVSASFSGVTIANGNSTGTAGGILNFGVATLSQCALTGNTAATAGGAIYNATSGTLTIDSCTLSGNAAASGGGIYSLGALAIARSTVSSNTASGSGGGIYNFNTAVIDRCLVTGNTATNNAGGINSTGVLSLTNSTLVGNTAKSGSALFTFSTTCPVCSAQVTNTTISGNNALNYAAVENYNYGGVTPTLTLTNSTLAGNSNDANEVGIIFGAATGYTANLVLQNTIVANFAGPTAQDIASIGAGTAQFTSLGNNLALGDGGGYLVAAGDLINTNPKLTALGNYGGTLPTMYPKPGSPAIDAGNDAGAPATDQRGVSRPVGAHADIGAVEADGELIFLDGFDGP